LRPPLLPPRDDEPERDDDDRRDLERTPELEREREFKLRVLALREERRFEVRERLDFDLEVVPRRRDVAGPRPVELLRRDFPDREREDDPERERDEDERDPLRELEVDLRVAII
jgi:hypothetical protein